MIQRIFGTSRRKQLVTNIVENMRKIRPEGSNFDYEILLKNKLGYSSLDTFENRSSLSNISHIDINDSFFFGELKAAIGNNSGAIDLEQIPFLMSPKKALKKIDRFLKLLLPENRNNPVSSVQLPADSSEVIKMLETFDHYQIQTVVSSSNKKAKPERIPRYKTL